MIILKTSFKLSFLNRLDQDQFGIPVYVLLCSVLNSSVPCSIYFCRVIFQGLVFDVLDCS